MTHLRSLAVSAAAALLLVAVTGCAGDADDPSSSGPTSTTTSQPSSAATSSSSSSEPVSDSEAAATAAASIVREYFAVVDRLRQDPKKPLGVLRTVATSGELTAERRLIRSERRQELRQVGDTRIAVLEVQSVNLANSDPQAGKVPTVRVDVCWDVSGVDILDKSGKSVVSPTRLDTGWIRFTVANYHWSTDSNGGWRVASSQDLEKTPCTDS